MRLRCDPAPDRRTPSPPATGGRVDAVTLPAPTYADADLGRAIRELDRAARAAGYRRPQLTREIDGWTAEVWDISGRRFQRRVAATAGDPVTAIEQVLIQLDDAGA